MPDASITSTESTFGTISGTFTADQSTISGTVYAITGTVDGSVGVPGPQGPAGSPGAQGPQGPQGVPGVGVPTGGTTGQVLQKASGTAYDTIWATPSGGTWGSITGTLSNQTDLQNALNAKQDVSGMSAYLTKAGNLTGLTDLVTARDNLQLGLSNQVEFFTVIANTGTTTTIVGDGLEVFDGVNPGVHVTKTGIRFDDNTVQTTAYPGPVGATTWGSIVGTLSNQTDLQTALNGKAPSAAGMPISGTVGQVLTKNSGTSYDASWQSFVPGDRYVTTSTSTLSVSNGTKSLTIGTGLAYTPNQDVTISLTSDPTLHHMHGPVTSYNSGTGALVVDVQNHTGSGTFSSWTVNVGGTVPLETVEWGEVLGTLGDQTDLATALNAKLEITDAASTYYLQTNPAGYIDSSALTGYATESWVTSQGYLTSSALTGYATESWVASQGYLTSSALTGYATESWVTSQGYLTSASLSGYATESWVTSGFYPLTGNPSGFITSAALSGYAPLASPGLTGNVTITSNSTSPALVITQDGTGDIVQFKDVTSDTTYSFIDASGKVGTIAATTANAGFNIAHGAAPTTPVNGDIWTTTSGLFMRQNGATRQYVDLDGTQTINGTKTFSGASQTLGNSTTAGTINIGTGAVASGTKAINIGTGTVAPGACTMVFGTAGVGGNITFNGNGTFNVANNNVQIHSNTATSTVAIGVGATVAAATKTVNIGTGGVASSTTNINLGTVDGGAATVTTNALLVTRASATTGSGLRVTPGVAPTSPVNGDVWTDTAGIYARINGATQTLTPPTAATVAEAKLGNDTAKFINCNVLQKVVNSPSYYKFPRGVMSTSTSGTGAAVTAGALITNLAGTTTGAGGALHRYYGPSGVDIIASTGWAVGSAGYGINFAKQFRITGSTLLALSTNSIVRATFGKNANDGVGDPAQRAIGWRYNQATGFIEIIAWNGGVGLISTTTASNPTGWFEWELYNNGSGSIQMFVNDVSIGTLTGGPTTFDFGSAPDYVEEIQCTATPAAQPLVRFRNGGLFLQP